MSVIFSANYRFDVLEEREQSKELLLKHPYSIPLVTREDLVAQGFSAQQAEPLMLYYRRMVQRMELAYPFDEQRRKLQAMIRRHQTGERGLAQQEAVRQATEQVIASHPVGQPLSLNTDLGEPITLVAFNALLGLDLQLSDIAVALEVGSQAMISGQDPQKVVEGWLSYRPVVTAIDAAIVQGTYDENGLLAALVKFAAENDRDRDMIVMSCALLIVAGSSVHRSFAPLLRVILDNPDIADAIAQDTSMKSLDELLRLHPPLQKISRYDADASVGTDKHFTLVDVAKANACPHTFEQPEQYCPTRNNNGSMTFGYGPYACDGAHITRIFLNESIKVLLTRTEGLRFVEGTSEEAPSLVYDSVK